MVEVGVYARLSEDRDGQQTATARQVADCKSLAKARSWKVIKVWEDVDLSAFRQVHRPGFEEMLADLDAGVLGGVVCWKLDRLARNRRDVTRLAEIVERQRCVLAAVNDPVDTSTEVGWVVFDMLMSMARMESANTSTRVKRAMLQEALEGRPPRRGQRPFGRTKDWAAIVPDEAEAIRDAARRVLAGESVNAIAKDWNRRGITTSPGNEWRGFTVSRLLQAPHLAALRVHQGAVVADGSWPAILDRTVHERLVALLSGPGRSRGGGGRARYLLSGGLLRCGLCGEQMMSRPREDGARRYVCRSDEGTPGCGKVGILALPADDLVTDAALHALASADLIAALRAERDGDKEAAAAAELVELEAALERLTVAHFADRTVDRRGYLAAKRRIEGRIAELQRILARRPAGPLDDLSADPVRLRAVWEAHDVAWRRALLGVVFEAVRVGPALRGRNRFDRDRVTFDWRV